MLVIGGSLSGDDDSARRSARRRRPTQDCAPDAQDAVENGYYVVQADDVEGLSGIADKTCIPLDTLIELNPNLDPQALQVANCVDLVVDGCKALSAELIAALCAVLVALLGAAPPPPPRTRPPTSRLPRGCWSTPTDGEVLAAHRARARSRSPRPRS